MFAFSLCVLIDWILFVSVCRPGTLFMAVGLLTDAKFDDHWLGNDWLNVNQRLTYCGFMCNKLSFITKLVAIFRYSTISPSHVMCLYVAWTIDTDRKLSEMKKLVKLLKADFGHNEMLVLLEGITNKNGVVICVCSWMYPYILCMRQGSRGIKLWSCKERVWERESKRERIRTKGTTAVVVAIRSLHQWSRGCLAA